MKKVYPTELIDFLQCRHRAYLKKMGIHGEEILSDEVELLRQKGVEHEKAFLETLDGVVSIDPDAPLEEQSRLTREAMLNGASFIYQAYLENDSLAGYPDFLEKVDKPSGLGAFSYRILDTKLAVHPTPANAVQLIHYAKIAEEIQGAPVEQLLIIHGDGSRSEVKAEEYTFYYRELLKEYVDFLNGSEQTEPFPIAGCRSCSYQKNCQDYWRDNDHLAVLNGIKPGQVSRLKNIEIENVDTLVKKDWTAEAGLSGNQFSHLKSQAIAQKNREIHLKDAEVFNSLKNLAAGGILLTLFQRFQEANGAKIFYAGLKTFPGERFEEIFVASAEEESGAFQRVISFAVRYLDKRPQCNLMVWEPGDIKLIHDLSNRYNICHDEVDSLIYNKKIVSIQGLITNAFYLPVENNRLSSVAKLFAVDPSELRILDKSPRLLNELLSSAGVENAGQLISERATGELRAIETVLVNVCRYEKDKFPVKLSL